MSNMDKPPKIIQPQCLDKYGLKPCTAEYLERMRDVTRQNCYDIKKFFDEHDPLEFGTVSDYMFKCMLHQWFMCQVPFNMEQIQLITEFFQMPDGMICYMRLHKLMISNENIADQLRECASQVPFPIVRNTKDFKPITCLTRRGMEQMPMTVTPPPEPLPNAWSNIEGSGAINMEDIPLPIRQLAKCAVARLRSRIQIESCNIKYFFKGFDKLNNGHVSRQQFKQTLSMLNYYFGADELDAMSVQYSDRVGFNYLRLLNDIEPMKNEPGWYSKYKTGRLYQLARERARN